MKMLTESETVNENRSSSYSAHKATILAFENELKIARSMLELQQKETRHCQEHISLLNGEIDALRKLAEEKQMEVHKLNLKIQAKTDKVCEFETTFDQFRVDKMALYELEQQNAQLLERLKEKQKVIDEYEIEISYLRNQMEDGNLVDESKEKKMAELQIVMPIEKFQLEVRLENALKHISELEENLRMTQSINHQLHQQMEWNDQIKRDQLARSNQSEFRMLLQLDKTEELVKSLESDKETLNKINDQKESRSNYVEKQYLKSLQKIDDVETMCGAVVDYVERDLAAIQNSEMFLRQENSRLQSELQLLHEVVTRSMTVEEFAKTFGSTGSMSKPGSTIKSRHGENFPKQHSSLHSKLSPVRSPMSGKRINAINECPPMGNTASAQLKWQESKFVEFLQMMESVDKRSLKYTCLMKQLSIVKDVLTSIQCNKLPSKCNIDFSSLYLGDDDVDEIINEFRTFSFRCISTLNLSGNLLTSEGLFKIITWILAMATDEIRDRNFPLEINLRQNKINTKCIEIVKKALRTRSDFKHANILNDDNFTLMVYGRGLSFDSTAQVCILRFDLNNQVETPPIDDIHIHMRQPFSSAISTVLPSPSKLPAQWNVETLQSIHDVYPRDNIMHVHLD